MSGNIAERISAPWFSPALTVNHAGDPAVESRAVNEVASYGTQMGWLNEVVLALADGAELNGNGAATLRRIADAVKKVDEIRDAGGQAALAAADASLDRLQDRQPEPTPGCCRHACPERAHDAPRRRERARTHPAPSTREAKPGPVPRRSLHARERLSTFRVDA